MGVMPGETEHVLFETELLRVVDYRCLGQDGQAEEANGHVIVMPRSGSYLRRDAFGTSLADANQALFFNRGQTYDVRHLQPGGDRSTEFGLKQDTALDLVRPFDPRVDEHHERPFPMGGFTVRRPGIGLNLSRLTLAARAGPSEGLALEEDTLLFLGSIMQEAFEARDGEGSRRAPSGSNHHPETVMRVKLLLHQGLSRKLTLRELAGQAGYSPYHLCRAFKAQTGLSIHTYLLRLRLHESLEQLVEFPRRSVTEIALSLGFASHSHFSSTFRAHFARSPRAYRAQANQRMSRELSKILKD
jgi:AraC-like DNA-binding protein